MKHFALAFLLAVVGCKKSNDAGGTGSAVSGSAGGATAGSAAGSATAGSATAGSATAGSATAGSAGPPAPFDDTLEMPKLPKRDKDEQARIDGAADTLRTALTAAKTAKDSAALCKAFPPLLTAMSKLQQISAPKGIDQQAFSSERDALLQLFDGADAWCDKPADIGLDTLQSLMSKVRTQFVDLVSRGAT